MKVLSAPEKVTLNITNRCNLHCLYCGVSSTKNAPGDLSLEEWRKVIDELARIKVFKLLISGGEPFIRPDLPEILEQILQCHFRVSINTNGTLFNDKVLSLLSQSRHLENIQISLDGPNSDIHDFIRGKGTFDKIREGIKVLRRRKIPFTFFIVVCRNNKDYLGEIVKFAKMVGASQITFSSLLPQGSALAHLDDLFLSFEEEKAVEAKLRRLNKRYPALVGGSLIQGIKMMDQISQIDVSELSQSDANRITSCGGSVTECSIRPEG
ncbi:MAG: radical SAM protein, partial [Deltaproteobacteria bacterium]|nr:radical SAM protein [Deltaproteobacteria bacterium]